MERACPYRLEWLLARSGDLVPELMVKVILQYGLCTLYVAQIHLRRCELVDVERYVIAGSAVISLAKVRCATRTLLGFGRSLLSNGAILQPRRVRSHPFPHRLISYIRPVGALGRLENEDRVDDFDDAPHIEDAGERPHLLRLPGSPHLLTEVHVRVHCCLRVEKERVDKLGGILRVRPRILDCKCDGIVQDRLGHRHRGGRVRKRAHVGIHLTVADFIWTGRPDYYREQA